MDRIRGSSFMECGIKASLAAGENIIGGQLQKDVRGLRDACCFSVFVHFLYGMECGGAGKTKALTRCYRKGLIS